MDGVLVDSDVEKGAVCAANNVLFGRKEKRK
jgi:hypothetical protein